MPTSTPTYAILGATGNCGTALIENLLRRQPSSKIRAYCRNQAKLLRLVPSLVDDTSKKDQVQIFEGSIHDIPLLASCIRDCDAVFLVVSTNSNVPGLRVGQDTALGVIRALKELRREQPSSTSSSSPMQMPKLLLLSSATNDEQLSHHTPALLHHILLLSASNVYHDLREAEHHLRAEEDWPSTIFVKPGALSIDIQRGHALSLTEAESPVSYLDLAAAMIEAADDPDGRYDGRNVSVVNTGGRARFPMGTPWCILLGLLSHWFPALHPYLPSTGPG